MKTIKVTACGLTDVGRRREHNEDAWLVSDLLRDKSAEPGKPIELRADERGVLLVVSDGMGGAKAGEVASAMVVESLSHGMEQIGAEKTGAIKLAVERANRDVWEASADPSKKGMGATLTAVYVEGATAHIAEVGDSRAYIIRGGRIRQVTRDQSYAQLLLDAGVLKPEEVHTFPMKNVVLQAMGQRENVSVEIGRLALRRGDRLLLCSDGLHGKVSDEEMRQVVLSDAPLPEQCKKLVAMANERGGEDNITVVIAALEGEGLPRFVEKESVTQTLEVVSGFDPAAAQAAAEAKAAKEKPTPPGPAPPGADDWVSNASPGAKTTPPGGTPADPTSGSRGVLLAIAALVGLAIGLAVLFLLRGGQK